MNFNSIVINTFFLCTWCQLLWTCKSARMRSGPQWLSPGTGFSYCSRLACAYSSFLPEEHEKIKRVYLLFDMPFNKALLETHSRLHKMEQLKIANYIDELRQHLEKVEDMQLKLKMALHLINVVDAVRID